MSKTTRREFIKRTSVAVAGLAALNLKPFEAAAAHASRAQIRRAMRGPFPPHRWLVVPGVHGYADGDSVAAGQTIALRISNTVPYRLSICRLGLKLDDSSDDHVLREFPEAAPYPQPIHPGSYVDVSKRLTLPLRALTLECWVRPWKITGRAGLITQCDLKEPAGCGLFLEADGRVTFFLGDGETAQPAGFHSTTPGSLKSNKWHHIVAIWDWAEKAIWIDGQQAASWPFAGPLAFGNAPLRLAAAGLGPFADYFLDGDLAMPAIYERALGADEIRARCQQQGLQRAKGRGVLACWPLTEERGDRLAEVSPHARHGKIINQATWMIGGPSFQPEVARFGDYDPRKDPRRGHGLRVASDDLYDCQWDVTQRWRVPANAKSGLYVGRLHYEWEGKEHCYHITFIVKKAKRAKQAPLLVLCASNTWRAYNSAAFGQRKPGLRQLTGTDGLPNSPGNPPAFSFYRGHAGGQGTFQVGLRMPWPAADPYLRYGDKTEYSHLARADRCAHIWLEQARYDFDMIADIDLHRDPDLLRGYRACLINGHSEYWSLPMMNGLEGYLKSGGNAIVLSGNSLFWRVSFNAAGTILEGRKVDAPGDQMPPARRGECWHSQDWLRGGLLRDCGHPGWKLIGLDCLGWNNQGDARNFGPYVAEATDYFLFRQPEAVGLQAGEKFGWAGEGKVPMANGHEIDCRLSTLAALQEKPNPPGATMPTDPPGITRLANGIIPWKVGGAAFDYFFRPIKPQTDQGGEMIYWERPDGGRVFNAGSIGAGWALMVDEKFQRLMRNVLAHFGVKRSA
ncbi:MAG: LamG domain-containing protein [Verrucomicrobia bacterium]|nr:LamG domain-containing protein [Verrucomicrobiota bacterium]